MTNKEKTARAQLAARKLQTLHGGDATELVLADFERVTLLSLKGKIGKLNVVGIVVLKKDVVQWAEVYADHGLRLLSAEEVAEEIARRDQRIHDTDFDPTHYAPEYRAASLVASIADAELGYRGPVHMGERVILDSSAEGTQLNWRWVD
jgi:hypothetical protein